MLKNASGGGKEGSVKTVHNGGYAETKSKWIMLLWEGGRWTFIFLFAQVAGDMPNPGENKDIFCRLLELKW